MGGGLQVWLLLGDQGRAARDRASQGSPAQERGELTVALCVLHLLACSHAIALLCAQEVQAEKEAKRLEKAAKLAAKRAAALPAPATPAAPHVRQSR